MSAVLAGARAKVAFIDPSTGLARIVGIFSSVDYGLNYTTEPAFILGRYSAAANDYTSQDIIRLTCSGYRIFNHGPFADAGLPPLQGLLTADYIQLALIDRQGELAGIADSRFAKFFSVRPTGFTTGANARSLQQMTFHYEALQLGDETNTNAEGAGATILPVQGF